MAFAVQPEIKVQLAVDTAPLTQLDPEWVYSIESFQGWNDITSDVRAVRIERGRANDLEKVGAGTASVVLSNHSRQYDPTNLAGPYVSISGQSRLLPRNQIRIYGVFPNDVIADGFCYNLQDETTRTPSAGAFDENGYYVDTPVSGGVAVNLTSTLTKTGLSDITMLLHVAPRTGVKWEDLLYVNTLAQLAGSFVVYHQEGAIRVVQDYAPYGTIFEIGLPTHIISTSKPFWLKLVVANSVLNHRVYYCEDQFQIPTTWTERDFSLYGTKSTFLTMSGTNTSVQIHPAAAYTTVNYYPHSLKRLVLYGGTTQYINLLCDTHISLFQGFVSGYPQEYQAMGKDATVTLSCFDASGLLGNMKVPTDVLETIIPPTSPWGWWKLGDASDTCVDYSGNAHDLAYEPTGVFDHVTDVRVASGLSGIASNFAPTTTTALIQSGHVAPDVTTNFSVSMWILSQQELFGTDKAQIFEMHDGTTRRLQVQLNTSVSVGSVLQSKALVTFGGTTLTSTNYVSDGLPHHICVTYNTSSGALKLYVDGSATKGTTGTATAGSTHGGKFTMGGPTPAIFALNTVNYRGALQDVVYWNNRELTAAEVTDIYNGGYGYIDESSGARMARIFDYADIPDRLQNIDPNTYATCGAVEYTEDQAVLELLEKVEDTEVGILFTNRSGLVTLRGRYYLSMADTGINRQAEFDDANINIGYRGLRFQYDAEQLVNDHIIVDDVGAEFQDADSTSVTAYGRRSRTIDTLLNDTTAARNMAIGLTSIYKEPLLKAEPFEIVPLSNEWLKVLPLDIGDRVNLRALPMAVGSQIDQDMALQSIAYDVTPKDWRVTIVGSPRPMVTFFVLGDSSNPNNLIYNPSAESGVSPFVAFGSLITVSRSTTDGAYSGFCSFKVVRALNTTGGVAYHGIVSGDTSFPVTASLAYTQSAYVRKLSGVSPKLYITSAWYNSSGTYLGESGLSSASVTITSTTDWVRLSITATAPVGAAYCKAMVREADITPSLAQSVWQVDAWMLQQGSVLNPYVEDSGSALDGPDVLGF